MSGRLLPLNLQVPQHHLPPLGQRGERPPGGSRLEPGDGCVGERDAGVELRDVVGRLYPSAGTHAVDVQPAYRGQEIGTKGDVGTTASLDHLQHLGEGLCDQVV